MTLKSKTTNKRLPHFKTKSRLFKTKKNKKPTKKKLKRNKKNFGRKAYKNHGDLNVLGSYVLLKKPTSVAVALR